MKKDNKLIILVVVFGFISLSITTGGFIYLRGKYAEQRAIDEAKQKAQLKSIMKQIRSGMVQPPQIPAPPVLPYPEIELGGTIEDRGPSGGGGGFTKNNAEDYIEPPQVPFPPIGGEGGLSLGGNIAEEPSKSKDTEGSHETQPLNQTKPNE